MTLRVLIACEFSQVVCKAFREQGHEAYSCDLLPTEGNPEWHIQDDVLNHLAGLPCCPLCGEPYVVQSNCFICHSCESLVPKSPDFVWRKPWDLMIAHPDCTYFANAGLHYLKTQPDRQSKLDNAFIFVKALWGAPISKIVIENPIGWLNTHWQKPSQIIQPSFFGVMELKTTCLWLKNLPPLMATLYGKPEPNGYCIRKTGDRVGTPYNYYWRQGKNGHDRSRTFPCIAEAMAKQWGSLETSQKGFENKEVRA